MKARQLRLLFIINQQRRNQPKASIEDRFRRLKGCTKNKTFHSISTRLIRLKFNMRIMLMGQEINRNYNKNKNH